MSIRALNLLLKQNDSHSSVAVWEDFAERGFRLIKRSKLRLDRSYRKYNRGTVFSLNKFTTVPTRNTRKWYDYSIA